MPELPEVEYGRKVAEKSCAKKVIQEVHCDNDSIVFEKKLPAEIKRALVGRRVLEICRRGKFLWFELDKTPWPIFHFGMTGSFHTPDQPTIQLESGPTVESSQWPPRFTKIRSCYKVLKQIVIVTKLLQIIYTFFYTKHS